MEVQAKGTWRREDLVHLNWRSRSPKHCRGWSYKAGQDRQLQTTAAILYSVHCLRGS